MRRRLTPTSSEPIRLRLDLAYDGTEFAGWACQPGLRTVQGELEGALATALRSDRPLKTVCAGRTDAGVHARGQVAHVDVPSTIDGFERLVDRLNGLLPPDIAVNRVSVAPDGFDARLAAVSRRYRYFVADRLSRRDPTVRRFTWQWREVLDPRRINEAALGLLGLHDFAAYCRARPEATTIRNLQRLECRRGDGSTVVVDVAADAFCHSLVRSLVGALVAVGSGRRPTSWPVELLAARRRSSEVQVAPAQGLFLEGVSYPPAAQYAGQIERARALRSCDG